jgi:uncharacterized membrane protein
MSIAEHGVATARRQAAPLGRRILRGLVVLLLLIVLLALLAAAGGLVYVQIKKSAPSFQKALETVQKDPQVVQALGQPIDDASLLPGGDENKQADRGEARWWFDVRGPKGRAHVYAQAACMGNRWSLNVLEVTPDNGQKIKPNLDADAGGSDDAPKWSPPTPSPPSSGKGPG